MLYKRITLTLHNFFGNFSIKPVLLIGFILRIININSPVIGIHSWRQADTASIARNFLENDLIFWQPQVNWSGSTNGFVECEFPLYQYLVASLYKIFGVNEIYARALSIIFGCFSIYFLFQLIKKVFNLEVAWWGSLFYAILPASVFYSRTIQPESLMMLLAILSLERWIEYIHSRNKYILFLSWLFFTLAVLIKVLPFFWIGIPIFITAYQRSLILKHKLYIFPFLTILICYFWYSYAYKLGQSTGLTFGLWGSDTDRYSWLILFEFRFYLDLLIRILFRNFLLIGFLPIYVSITLIGMNNIFFIGIISVLLTGLISPISFSIHEYYQLPIMIFSCPLMGYGFVRLKSLLQKERYVLSIFMSLLILGSLTMLKIDYWDLELTSIQPVWNTSQLIKNNTNKSDLIISITGGDPTLLYLSNRKGWLLSPSEISNQRIMELKNEGAQYISGSWEVVESYNNFSNDRLKANLNKIFCSSNDIGEYMIKGCNEKDKSYLIQLR
tara:strand:+ start:4377 stop:5873 length:1497 start_codon:yes stop_codon:yes gene_type:complete